MAYPTLQLIQALRKTADRLETSAEYKWSHFAHCNCGHLAQTVTGLSAREIQDGAMRREGDWGEQAVAYKANSWNTPRPLPEPDFGDRPALDEGAWEPENIGACTVTGTPLDRVLDQLYAIGMTETDVQCLERLSDARVRRRLGANQKEYLHYERANVVAYLRAWSDLLSEELPSAPELLAAAE